MINGDVWFEVKELKQTMAVQNKLFKRLFSMVDPAEEMWDDQKMIQNWHVSRRTLADWRKEGVIGYVQKGKKIWYPREAREQFIKNNYVEMKGEIKNES